MVANALKQLTSYAAYLVSSKQWLWWGFAALGGIIHGGTAVLRLDSFWPHPQAKDFASYYTAAWAIRLNESSLVWSDELLQFLHRSQNLTVTPPLHNSPPIWAWLLQPISNLKFSQAATLWLCLLLLMAVYCHVMLVGIAGYTNWNIILLTLPVTLTFGPLFLNLTLGQNGIFLLLCLVTLGISLQYKPRSIKFSVPLWVLAVAAKLFPAIWLACLLFLRRWRTFMAAYLLCLIAFGLVAFLEPEINKTYWFDFLPNRNQQFTNNVSIDDQSVNGFLTRLGKEGNYQFPGLGIADKHQVTWSFPWEFSPQTIQLISYSLLFFLGLVLVLAWAKNKAQDADAILYSLALFSVMLFSHMERYNHIIALPAMAWLWRLNTPYRKLAMVAYGFLGLSRLNHLLALLPSPLGPVATGFGLFGILVLMLGIAHALVYRPTPF